MNSAGNALLYSSYLGGSFEDQGYGIAVDSNDNAYLTGKTASSDFPTHNPFQAIYGNNYDVFVAKVSEDGSNLLYSTFLGGSSADIGFGIAVDSSGNVYLSGFSSSTDFPTSNPFQIANNGGNYDAFVTKLNSTGNALLYSSYLGGSGEDRGESIAIDNSGNAYVMGQTNSNDFPTTPSSFQPIFGGGSFDIFVTEINMTGSAKVYSSYLGGSSDDVGRGIAVDSNDNAYLTGQTNSNNFPTSNPIQAAFGGWTDAFVTKVSTNGSTLVYSSYLGGSGDDVGRGIAVDSNGNAYVMGQTSSGDFPLINPFQSIFDGGNDAFITKISGDAACPFTLTSSSDDGGGTSCGTLSYALKQATIYAAPVTITLPSQITFTGPMPVVTPTATITLAGICTDNNGRGTPGSKIIAGSGAGNNALNMTNNMVLSGVTVTGFSGYALNITGSNNTVSCSWLGTADGSTPAANGGGVRLAGSNNKLGLPNLPLSGNLISGNSGLGLQVENGSKNNTAYYNLIGYTADGSGSLRNGGGGVKVLSGGQLKFGLGNKVR